MATKRKVERWYWLDGSTFRVEHKTDRAYKLIFGGAANGEISATYWIPKSQLRITPGKDDWEIAAWYVAKNDLHDLVTDEEPHE